MSILTASIPVPSSGDGTIVSVANMIGPKTVQLAGQFSGYYDLLASHDDVNFVAVASFNAGGLEGLKVDVEGSFKSLRLRANAQPVTTVTCEVSAVNGVGQNGFGTVATLAAGYSGTTPIVDTAGFVSPGGSQEDTNFICRGDFQGSIIVLGSIDGSAFNPLGEFRVERRPEGSPPIVEFSPLITGDNVRYIRLQVGLTTGTTTVTFGGQKLLTPPDQLPLATLYANGARPAGYAQIDPTTIVPGSGVNTLLTLPIAVFSNIGITARIWGADGLDRQFDCELKGTFSRFVGTPTVRNYSFGSPYRLDVPAWSPSLTLSGNDIVLQITADPDSPLVVSAQVEVVSRTNTAGTTGETSGVWIPCGTVLEASTVDEGNWIQEPNLLYDTDPQILVGNAHVFKLWYSQSLSANFHIGYAESTDCVHWTKLSSNPMLIGYTRCGNVSRVGGYYYLTAVAPSGILHFLRSSNGVTGWTSIGTIARGVGADWDVQINNSTAWYEGGTTWHVMYDGVSGVDGWYRVGGATSTDMGVTWAKWAGNPVISTPTIGLDAGGTVGGPFTVKVAGTYYCWVQASPVGTFAPTDIVRFQSIDLVTWTQSFEPFAFQRFRPANRSQTAGIWSQVADVTMCEVNGLVYMIYSGLLDSNQDSHFELAVAPMPFSSLVSTTEGIDNDSPPEMLIDASFEGIASPGYTTCFGWTDTTSDGAIARTTTVGEFHADSSRLAAIKITAGPLANTRIVQTVKGLLGGVYTVSSWARGDGTHAGRIRIQDTTGTDLLSWPKELNSGTAWAPFMFQFAPPVDGVVILSCYCPATSGGIAYFDDLSIQGIAGSALDTLTPTQDPSCVLYLRADGPMIVDGSNRVSRWQDESGNDNDALQATVGIEPVLTTINRVKSVTFDGIDDYMATVAGAILGPLTIYVVCEPTAIHARFDGIVAWGSEVASGKEACLGLAANNWWYGNNGYGTPISSTTVVLNQPIVLAKTWDGTSSRGYRNGRPDGAPAANALTSCDGVVLIGLQTPGSGSFAAVRIRCIIGYATLHDDATIARRSLYLRNAYRLLNLG